MATICASTLRAIRQFEQQCNAADLVALSSLRSGDRGRFRDPVFGSLEGLVRSVSSRRIAVLLELMGRLSEKYCGSLPAWFYFAISIFRLPVGYRFIHSP